MDRRQFLKDTSMLFVMGWAMPSWTLKAFAQTAEPSSDLLNGIIPASAAAAVSSLYRFPHYHYLYLPRNILANPPAAGYSTATSMVVANLGVSPTLIDQNRHYHYHVINFTQDQIINIASGKKTTVDIYLAGALNHRFVFEKPRAFEKSLVSIRKNIEAQGLRTSLPGPVIPRKVE